jgi:hypothetical protein
MSLVILLGTSARIVAASDSRRWFTDGPPAPEGKLQRYQDDANKIRVTGRFVVGAVGETEAHPGSLDVWHAWGTLPVTAETAAQRLERFVAMLAAQTIVRRWAVVATIGVFGFAPVPDGAIVRLRCEPGGKLEVVARGRSDHFPIIAAMGWDDLPFETINRRLQAQLVGSPSEAEMTMLARDVVADVARQTDKVGGHIHVAVVDAMGARWISTSAGAER